MRLFRRSICAGVLLLCLATQAFAAFAIFQVSSNNPTTTGWHTLSIGAGGTPRHGTVATDGTVLLGTDTYGAYVKLPGGTRWYQLMTTGSMPAGTLNSKVNAAGVYEIAICSGNTNVAYIIYGDGKVYKTTNLKSAATGVTWTQLSAFSALAGPPIANPIPNFQNNYGPLMACDPANTAGNILLIGTPTNGAYVTSDGGTSFSKISGIANGTGNGTAVIFDPTSSVTGSGSTAATQGIYALATGTGTYRSTGGAGGTFNRLNTTNEPSSFNHLFVDTTGKLWVVTTATGTAIRTYNGSAWSINTLSDATGTVNLTVSPQNSLLVVAFSPFGFIYISQDGGATWASGASFTTVVNNGDTPWLSTYTSNNPSITIGAIFFDPLTSGQLDMIGGQFDYWTGVPTADLVTPSITYTPLALGIEQLDAQVVLAPTGTSNVVLGSLDLPIWYKTSATFNTNATTRLPSYGSVSQISHGWSADWCGTSPTTIAFLAEEGFGSHQVSGVSTNGGASYTAFGQVPAFSTSTAGGTIACSTPNTMVWLPRCGTKPYRTTNGGSSWVVSTTSFTGNFAPCGSTGLQASVAEADKTTTGVFYIFQALTGLFKSTDGGDNWTLQAGDPNTANSASSMTLKCSYLQSGKCFYSAGWQSVAGMSTGEGFYKTTGGAFSSVGGMCSVQSFNFGAQVSGQSYASMYAVGWYNAADTTGVCDPGSFTYTFGIWKSLNDAASWTQVLDVSGSAYPLQNPNWIPQIDGDKQIQGQFYLSNFGAGFMYYTP